MDSNNTGPRKGSNRQRAPLSAASFRDLCLSLLRRHGPLAIAAGILLPALIASGPTAARVRPADTQSSPLTAFAAEGPIDVHVHLYKDDPAFSSLLERLNL